MSVNQQRSLPLVRRATLLFFALLCFAGCDSCNPWPQCSHDGHCRADKSDNPQKKNFYCINKQCQECRTALDCSDATFKCEGYKCEKRSCSDVICPQGMICDEATLACKWPCEQDGESPCGGDRCKVCQSRQCVAKPPACSKDTDCQKSNEICRAAGTCEATCTEGCSAAKPCPPGYKCVGDRCEKDACTLENIYFDLDKSFIRGDAKSTLRRNRELECLKTSTQKVLIEGHCDERGSREYNMQLGNRRARATKKFLSSLGIEASRLCIVSKGKEELEVPNASTEDQHQKNRRAVMKLVDACP